MKNYLLKSFRQTCFIAFSLIPPLQAAAAMGDMGTGLPHFGVYSAATGANIRIFSLTNATVNFPAGCSYIMITRATTGDDYKILLSVILAAKSLGKPVRFYAHAERDGGCGVDYVQMD